ncbi:MAG: DNA polymerase III subunit beta [Desulfuromonadaceae bacterium]|nr:DNA polymerase III subunit beta [Desulfuromonadaceae bacterium]
MHIEINKDPLTKNLLLIQSIVEKKKTLPILSNVLIKAEQGFIYLTATDLEISIKIKLEANVIEDGTTTLPAKKLFEITKEMPEQLIKIVTQPNNWITIQSGKSEFNLAAIDASEYPDIKDESAEIVAAYKAKDLKNIIDKCINCISNDEKKYNLNGLFVHTEGKMIHYVATDGHRLVCIKEAFPHEDKKLEQGFIIPKKGLLEIKKICENTDNDINMRTTNGKIILDVDCITLSIRLIDATFPNYRRVIPEKSDIKAHINTQKLFDSIKRVSIISDEKNRTINLALSADNLEIYSKTEYGNATERIEINYALEDRISKFKANYLLDILSNIDCEEVELYLGAGGKPSLILPQQSDNYCAVLMPISV